MSDPGLLGAVWHSQLDDLAHEMGLAGEVHVPLAKDRTRPDLAGMPRQALPHAYSRIIMSVRTHRTTLVPHSQKGPTVLMTTFVSLTATSTVSYRVTSTSTSCTLPSFSIPSDFSRSVPFALERTPIANVKEARCGWFAR